MTTPRDQRGFALLLVLSIAAVLALLGARLAAAGKTEALIARNLAIRATMERAADGGVRMAIFRLLGPPEQAWPTDGERRLVMINGVNVSVRIEGEKRGIDPNTAPAAELTAVLTAVGVDGVTAPGLALTIAAFRERRSGAPVFASPADLAKVPGMTPAIAERLKPRLVFPGPTAQAASAGGQQRLTITASVDSPGGNRATRRATVNLSPGDPRRPYRILTWEVPGA